MPYPLIRPVFTGRVNPTGSVFAVIANTPESHGSDFTDTFSYALGITPEAGDLLVHLGWHGAYGAGVDVAPSGWTELIGSGSSSRLFGYYKVAAGTEGPTDTIDYDFTSASRSTAILLQIRGQGGSPETTIASSGNNAIDPPSHTPSGGSAYYLWIAALAWSRGAGMGSTNPGITAAPTGYANLINIQNYTPGASSGARGGTALAWKFAEASADDPDAFTAVAATAFSTAATISIPGS